MVCRCSLPAPPSRCPFLFGCTWEGGIGGFKQWCDPDPEAPDYAVQYETLRATLSRDPARVLWAQKTSWMREGGTGALLPPTLGFFELSVLSVFDAG